MRVDNAGDAPDLGAVAVEHGGEVFFWVVEDEPGALAEVGALMRVVMLVRCATIQIYGLYVIYRWMDR
jgi:hypothetical protein